MLGAFMFAYLLFLFLGWSSLIAWMFLLTVVADWLQDRQELRQEREDFPRARVLR